MTDIGRTKRDGGSKPHSMSRTSLPAPGFVMTTLVVIAAATTSSVGCAPMVQTCAAADDCASGQRCMDGACMDGSARDELDEGATSVEVMHVDIGDREVLLGASPRVVVGDGGVDIYFLSSARGELMRARPMLGSVEVIAVPPEDSTFSDLDVARSGAVDHAVVRRRMGEGSRAVTLEIDAAGLRGNMMSFPTAQADDRLGLIPRVAVDDDGVAHAAWAHGHDGVMDLERVTLPATSSTESTHVGSLLNFPSGLALTFDDANVPVVFSLDYELEKERLLANDGSERLLARPTLGGSIDATRCAGDVVTAFRDGDGLFLAVLPADGSAPRRLAIDDNLAVARLSGDLDIACVDDTIWLAHQSNDRLRVYTSKSGSAQPPLHVDVDDAATTLGLAIVGGVAHVVYATMSGALRYATITR